MSPVLPPDRLVSRDRGATALEYVAGVLIAALLASALYLAIATANVQQAVCQAVGTILQQDLGCSGEAAPKTDEDYQPDKCKTNETSDKASSKVKIFFIEIGQDAGFVVTEFSDGSVTMTATDGAGLGATTGVGADASFGKLEAGAKVDFGGGVEFDYGSTWTFKDKGEAEAMRSQLNQYLIEQRAMKYPEPGMPPPIILDPTEPPKPPSSTVSSVKTTGEVKATLGISATDGAPKGEESKVPAAEVVGSVGGDAKWTERTDTEKGTTTYTTELNTNSSLTGQIWSETFGPSDMSGASMAVTKDKDGNITNITFVTTNKGAITDGGKASGSSKDGGGSAGASSKDETATVTTTSVDIDPGNDSQQKIARDWLGGDSNYSSAGALTAGDLNPEKADPNDPFQSLVHSNGKVSAVTYDNVTDEYAFGANVKLGVALGFDFSLAHTESKATDASYLGAPDSDGVRRPIPYTDCVG